MPTTALFVYGTLKRGLRNNHFLAGQKFLGEARTVPRYRLYDGGPHPCLVEDSQGGVAVRGEIWHVDEDTLTRLDELEDAPRLFARCPIDIAGLAAPVVTYLYRGNLAGMKDCRERWTA